MPDPFDFGLFRFKNPDRITATVTLVGSMNHAMETNANANWRPLSRIPKPSTPDIITKQYMINAIEIGPKITAPNFAGGRVKILVYLSQ